MWLIILCALTIVLCFKYYKMKVFTITYIIISLLYLTTYMLSYLYDYKIITILLSIFKTCLYIIEIYILIKFYHRSRNI